MRSCSGFITYFAPIFSASSTMPISRVMENAPSSSSVVAALRDFGFRKAGTPLLMASTPVSAAQPEENDRATRKISASPVRLSCSGTMPKSAVSEWMS